MIETAVAREYRFPRRLNVPECVPEYGISVTLLESEAFSMTRKMKTTSCGMAVRASEFSASDHVLYNSDL